MAKSYVKFEVSADVVSKTYEALQQVKQSGKIRKGANEVTKSVEQGIASFVVIASDVEPEEVVIHIPKICEQKKIPYSYVPSKLDLGKSIGLNVPCTAIAVENAGAAEHSIKDIISKVTGTTTPSEKPPQKIEQKAQEPKRDKKEPKKEQPKKEAAQDAAMPAAEN